MIVHMVGRLFVVMLVLLATVSPARAQSPSGIAGVVRDTSGAVLPGVTVEASSPALIEKLRAVVTDGQGQYNIVDLRPGTYTVAFALAGFNTVRREGVELTAGFTATVNADLRVGAVEETITVTGASPLVDTHNVRQQQVASMELLETLPVGSKAASNFVTLVPGLTGTANVGGAAGTYATRGMGGTFHGKGGTKIQFDGMRTNNMEGSGSTGYMTNTAAIEEMTLETGGVSAESAASGIVMNMIPKEGGNSFRFGAAGLFSNGSMQGDNLTDEFRARGLSTANKVINLYDVSGTVGGPIVRDRLWFFSSNRAWGNRNQVAGVFFNKTQGTPFYTPDLDRPADRYEYYRSFAVRLTWQASPRNKVNFYSDLQNSCTCRHVFAGFSAPEAQSGWKFWPQGLFQSTWTSPLTSRLLIDAGTSAQISHWPNFAQPGVEKDHISILEQSTGFRYNAATFFGGNNYGKRKISDRFAHRFAVSYVTGSHALKTGITLEHGVREYDLEVNGDVAYTFLNAAPVSITQYATPYLTIDRLKADLGLYVQDQWTVKRLTLNMGLRFDYLNAYVPEQHLAAGPWVPARDFAPVHNVPLWKDINPRLGASYDLFGNGKTAIKASLGRYLGVTGSDIANANNPVVTSVNTVNRSWSDGNVNYVPDCDLRSPLGNGECGPFSDSGFGQSRITTRYADEAIHGFRSRDSNWDSAVEIQHEIARGVSLTGGYYRNWYNNFRVTDNLVAAPDDYSPFCITAPLDSRLPGGGGYPVCGLYDLAPAKFGQVDNLVTQASNYGRQRRVSNFFNASINTRLGQGIRLGGGLDTGRTLNDNCFVVDSPQQLLNCHVVTPFKATAQVKVHGSYTLPADLVVSGVFQSLPGPQVQANYPATNSQIRPSLGRDLAGCRTGVTCTSTATVPLIAPMTLFEDRQSQLDLRVSKVVRVGTRVRLQANLDLYNVLNSHSILAVNNTFGSQWRRPTSILDARLVQVGGQLSF
ncbi:MAG: TonB-dependent receptor plug domain-containing protein [Luteitalea sp.]|nr:TonB-dependent receptor plug domain-containing protein [Luteitalea sp.]